MQMLPGAPEDVISAAEQNIENAAAVTDILKNADAEELARVILSGMEPVMLSQSPVEYRCYCGREQVLKAVTSISENDLEELTESGENIHISCQFCDREYVFSPHEILDAISAVNLTGDTEATK